MACNHDCSNCPFACPSKDDEKENEDDKEEESKQEAIMSRHKHFNKQTSCGCNDTCSCGEDCTCTEENKCSPDCTCGQEKEKCSCGCEGDCSCDETCSCGCDDKPECDDDCTCGCHEDGECDCDKQEKPCEDTCECDKQDNYLELAQRIQAEFDNYRKRTREAEKQSKQNGIVLAVEKFLPVIDSIDNAKKQVTDADFIKSLDLVASQIMQSLESLGVKKIETENQIFDPNYHNAVLTGNDPDKKEDEILEEYQAGFMLDGKVIRHSVVKVNKL